MKWSEGKFVLNENKLNLEYEEKDDKKHEKELMTTAA